MSAARSGVAVARNDWTALRPRAVGSVDDARLAVSVVIPAQNSQENLDRCLAGLAAQNYPAALIEVIVADDRSAPPLVVGDIHPATVKLLPVTAAGYGSGFARDAGARVASGDVLLFIDADIIPDRHHVDAHLRWHELTDDAVVLGAREFVDVTGTSPAAVNSAVSQGALAGLCRDRERTPHEWIDRFYAISRNLTADREDLWRPVVGASVSVRRAFYAEVGGFAHFPIRGIVDTEFGYRAFAAGGVLIPEPQAASLHQGARTFDSRGDEIKRKRAPLIANHVPSERFRQHAPGRRWAVPYLHAIVPAGQASLDSVRATVDSLLASDMDDLRVTVVGNTSLSAENWPEDDRVRMVAASSAPTAGFPSAATLLAHSGVDFAPESISKLVSRLRTWRHGLISVAVTGVEAPVELWATRALCRCQRHAGPGSILRDVVRRLFGETWVAGEDLGVTATFKDDDAG